MYLLNVRSVYILVITLTGFDVIYFVTEQRKKMRIFVSYDIELIQALSVFFSSYKVVVEQHLEAEKKRKSTILFYVLLYQIEL